MIGRWKRRGNHLATARLSVRRHFSWYAQTLMIGLIAVVLAAASMTIYRYGVNEGRRDPHAALAIQGASVEAGRLSNELQDARQKLTTLEQQLRLESATRETLSRQLAQLQTENGSLRDHMAFYESLLTKTDRAPALAIDQFSVEPISPGRYRLRATLVQGQSSQEAFRGEVDFRLTLERNGKRETINWPMPHAAISVSRFARLERETDLGADARLKQVEMRIYAAGDSRVRLSRIHDVKG